MDQKTITLIVSDLHMGDGKAGDDFVDNTNQFATFVNAQAASPEGQEGKIELIINGDFLELAQVFSEAYKGDSSLYWCSESESVQKLERVLAGHPKVFDALAKFALKNQVTLFPGNHDVELHWPDVRKMLQERVPGINIETDKIVYERHGGRLHISHGHLFPSIDPANGFRTPENPILTSVRPPRLEMCAGTLFMVKFVNLMEAKYPFADNLSPITDLIWILGREKPFGLAALAWMLARFAVQNRAEFLSVDAEDLPIGPQLLDAIQSDENLQRDIATTLYGKVLGRDGMTESDVMTELATQDAIADLIEQLFRADPSLAWTSVFDSASPGTSSLDEPGSEGGTLSILASSRTDASAGCIEIAQGRWNVGAQVVVLGHTHLPQTAGSGAQRYYNPGSWTRYVLDASKLTLKDLENESTFPYQLNCVRVEDTGGTVLQSSMINIEKRP
jgi:UDP-2,3-diacylglucosamine pyrophosphatase LpxH